MLLSVSLGFSFSFSVSPKYIDEIAFSLSVCLLHGMYGWMAHPITQARCSRNNTPSRTVLASRDIRAVCSS